MVEAARGFLPRNSAAYLDPRSTIVIDDAKTFFTARRSRYDIIVSEPSNPWVSGVASLFTSEFYRRIRGHLAPGGLLAQWFQLYEIDPARVASVMRALGAVFPNPFQSQLNVQLALAHPVRARLSVYDLGGRRIRTLLDGMQPPGNLQVSWDGRSDDGVALDASTGEERELLRPVEFSRRRNAAAFSLCG